MPRESFDKDSAVVLVAEVFRACGYEGASLSVLTARTGLSKGSLYHFFPGGKAEMAAEVLAHVDAWFAREVFAPLEEGEARAAIAHMWAAVETYFQSGRRICLVGAFALDETRERFAAAIGLYFRRWISALAGALARGGMEAEQVGLLAAEVVGGIQGALTLARALGEPAAFPCATAGLRRRTLAGPVSLL